MNIQCTNCNGSGVAGFLSAIRCGLCEGTGRVLAISTLQEIHDVDIDDLETMLASYIEAALWSTSDESRDDGGDPLDENYGPDDIDPTALVSMREDCRKFIAVHRDDIEAGSSPHGTYEQAGHDFWLTRGGHGVGFWCRDGMWPNDGETLTATSEKFGECYLSVNDSSNLLYVL